MDAVTIGDISIGTGELVLIAGPCVIESEKHARFMAERLAEIAAIVNMPFIFKASFDKANRSSIESYRGPGIVKGLDILSGIKQSFKVALTTDIHEPDQAETAAQVVDIIQIPAFLCRQTDILVASGETGIVVNVKKGQFMAPWDMANAVKKIESTGNKKVLITERGASFGYNNLVCDLRSLGLLRSFNKPVVFDVTHSLQLPGGKGDSSGGNREFIAPLARAGVAFGIDAVFLEVHDHPQQALSDGANSLSLHELEPLLRQLLEIHEVVA
ncbi:MAG TPA: 3-deoxy-8-phosphooctulonate synthase [Deltaproteobacteria bacterium]|nr:3-deoxy-8-phosphooctulonate synthase [Deltaproteobacteria bacterium]